VLLHARHELFEIFFADDLRKSMSASDTREKECANSTLLG
jgi:hypothetical protein